MTPDQIEQVLTAIREDELPRFVQEHPTLAQAFSDPAVLDAALAHMRILLNNPGANDQ